jgi:hypothetical protein
LGTFVPACSGIFVLLFFRAFLPRPNDQFQHSLEDSLQDPFEDSFKTLSKFPRKLLIRIFQRVKKMISTAHILCVGHDRMLLNTRRWILEALYQVDIAATIPDATDKIAKISFDLVILCNSLSLEECSQVGGLVRGKAPKTKVLRLLGAAIDGTSAGNTTPAQVYSDQEMDTTDGPPGLLKKTIEMLH